MFNVTLEQPLKKIWKKYTQKHLDISKWNYIKDCIPQEYRLKKIEKHKT